MPSGGSGCPVHALGLAAPELLLERGLRRRVLREDDEPRRVAIDAMYDERPHPAPASADVIRDLIVDGRRVRLALERHGQQAGRLVHDEQVVVFVQDLQVADDAHARPRF